MSVICAQIEKYLDEYEGKEIIIDRRKLLQSTIRNMENKLQHLQHLNDLNVVDADYVLTVEEFIENCKDIKILEQDIQFAKGVREQERIEGKRSYLIVEIVEKENE